MEKILEVAISQIGVEEDKLHTNHGEAVKYQIAAGLPKGGGFAWCQSFVYWCGLQAYGETNPIPKTGGVLDCWNKLPKTKKILKANLKVDMIKPGSQFFLDEGKGLGHTGIIESVDANGTLHTIEGNSNNTGSRDGYQVCRQSKRKITDKQLIGIAVYF